MEVNMYFDKKCKKNCFEKWLSDLTTLPFKTSLAFKVEICLKSVFLIRKFMKKRIM